VALHELPQRRIGAADPGPDPRAAQETRNPMSEDRRVVLWHDDGSKIDFQSEADVNYHLAQQGLRGVVRLSDEESGEEIADRAELDRRVETARAEV
jgi:hypothetical protein